MNFLEYVIIVALIAAFIITLSKKLGIVEHVQVHGSEFFAEMFNCDFCLSWWTSVAVALVFCVGTGNAMLLVVPFCSTMICRFLL